MATMTADKLRKRAEFLRSDVQLGHADSENQAGIMLALALLLDQAAKQEEVMQALAPVLEKFLRLAEVRS